MPHDDRCFSQLRHPGDGALDIAVEHHVELLDHILW
jgi:hypothetical protein